MNWGEEEKDLLNFLGDSKDHSFLIKQLILLYHQG